MLHSKKPAEAKMFVIDLNDDLFYLNDLQDIGLEKLQYFIDNCLLSLVVMPLIGLVEGDKP